MAHPVRLWLSPHSFMETLKTRRCRRLGTSSHFVGGGSKREKDCSFREAVSYKVEKEEPYCLELQLKLPRAARPFLLLQLLLSSFALWPSSAPRELVVLTFFGQCLGLPSFHFFPLTQRFFSLHWISARGSVSRSSSNNFNSKATARSLAVSATKAPALPNFEWPARKIAWRSLSTHS